MNQRTINIYVCFVFIYVFIHSSIFASTAQQPNAQSTGYIENEGQWADSIRYKAKYPGAIVWITNNAVYFDFIGEQKASGKKVISSSKFRSVQDNTIDEVIVQKHCIRMDFNQASILTFIGNKQSVTTYNFMIGNNLSSWVTNVASFETVELETDKGYSVLFTTDNSKPRFDFILKPQVDVNNIAVRYTGATSVELIENEVLAIQTTCGAIYQGSLNAYQLNASFERTHVPCSINVVGNIAKFSVGMYNTNTELVIDPTVYATYLGTDGTEEINAIKQMPNNGDIIAVGYTSASTFPKTVGAYTSSSSGNDDVFISRFDNTFSTLIYSTYFGGSGNDKGFDISITKDENRNFVVVGETTSSNFPTTSGFFSQNNLGKTDVFITKLNNAGNQLLYSTYFGGSDDDRAYGVITDEQNNTYFCGETFSNNLMTKVGSFKTTYGGAGDGFVACLASTNQLSYSTYYGGSGRDRCLDIASSSTALNEAFVTGDTKSSDLPLAPADIFGTPNPAQTKLNGTGTANSSDAFIAKFNAFGSKVLISTYMGGGGDETGYSIIVDNGSKALIAGSTTTGNLSLIRNLPQGKKNGIDGLLCGLEVDGRSFNYLSYFGGDGDDIILDVKSDGQNLIVGGKTTSNNFPVTNDAGQPENKLSGDGFIASLAYNTAFYCSYLGGTGNDEIRSVIGTNTMMSYFGGVTNSSGLSTPGKPYQQNYNGVFDGFAGRYTYSSLKVNTPVATDKPCAGSPINILWDVSNFAATDLFTVEASSDNGINWQMLKNNVVARNYNWIIPSSQPSTSNYRIRVTHNASGLAILNPAPFTVRKPATITYISADTSLCQNTPLQLVTHVVGFDIKYQWQKNGNVIDGATNATYNVTQADNSSNGIYTVKITASCTSALTSNPLSVTVTNVPSFETNLTNVDVKEGAFAELKVKVISSEVDYKWQKFNGNNWLAVLNAPNAPTLTFNTTQKFDVGTYRVIISNRCGIDTSDEAKLSITTTDVQEYSNNNDWLVFPNPATSTVSICNQTTTNIEAISITMCDVTGKHIPVTLMFNSPDCITVHPTNVHSGLYIIRFNSGQHVYRYPVVIID